jgi:hypothetical protein
LQPTVIGIELARDETLAALRQKPPEIGGVGVEIDELERARFVLDKNLVRRPRAPASASLAVFNHRDLERSELADTRIDDPGCKLPVDDRDREMKQKVDHARMRLGMPRGDQLVEQPFDTRADALQGANRGEQRS